MKKQESFKIICQGRTIHQNLTESEMFEIMEELSLQYYETGVPNPGDIVVECVSIDGE